MSCRLTFSIVADGSAAGLAHVPSAAATDVLLFVVLLLAAMAKRLVANLKDERMYE